MPFTWKNTSYREKVGSPTHSSEADGSQRSTRTLYVPDANGDLRQAFIDILGHTEIGRDGAGNKFLSRQIPMPFDKVGRWKQFAKSMRSEGCIPASVEGERGYDQVTEVQLYDEHVCNVDYEAPIFGILDDAEMVDLGYVDGNNNPDESKLTRYVSVNKNPIGRYQTLPPFSALKWISDGKPMSATAAIPMYEEDIEITWHQVPRAAYSETTVKNCIGKTNQHDFGSLYGVVGPIPAGTLVCGVPRIKLYRMSNGEYCYDVTYKFRHYPNGANFFYRYARTGGPGWEEASRDGTNTDAQKIFRAADFADLFRVA